MTALYDRIGRDYDVTRQADPEIVRRLRVHLQLRDGRPVLDVGCGTGNYTIALAETGLMMTGADVSREMIRQAERKSDRVKWVQADAEALPFPDGTFDGATMVLCAHPGRGRGDPRRMRTLACRYQERPDRPGARTIRRQPGGLSVHRRGKGIK